MVGAGRQKQGWRPRPGAIPVQDTEQRRNQNLSKLAIVEFSIKLHEPGTSPTDLPRRGDA